jgi:phage repressor protein C with HTH and peptisase S24 domain
MIRTMRIIDNVENASRSVRISRMANAAETFRDLRKRAGYPSLAALAPDMGYRGASSIQRYENPAEFEGKTIPLPIVQKIAAAIVGKGDPPITADEVYALAGVPAPRPRNWAARAPDLPQPDLPPPNVDLSAAFPAPSFANLPRTVPIYGVAVGGNGDEADFRFNGDVVDYAPRPPGIAHLKDAFVLYIVNDSMYPWRKPGQVVYLHPTRPARAGDHVVVEEHGDSPGEPGPARLKQLLTRTPTRIKLAQYNPQKDDIWIDLRRVKRVYRVIEWEELLGV